MKNNKNHSKTRTKVLLQKGDAVFRKSALYRYILKHHSPTLTLDKVLKISSKIPGSLSAEVVAERKKGRG